MEPNNVIIKLFYKISGARRSFRRVFQLFLVLLLNFTIAVPGSAVTVEAAPLATIFNIPASFQMSITLPDTICAGYDYPVKVAVRVDFQRSMGGINIHFSDLVVPGITIDTSSGNTSVATISPGRSVSGVLQNDLLPTASFGSSSAGMGEVTFMLHAIKAGSSTLYFNATVPAQLTQSDALPLHYAYGITVENCAYRVSLNGRWSVTYPNLTTTLTDTTKGQIVKDASGQLTGTGDATWSLRSFSVMCPHSHSLTLDHAQLSGQTSGDYVAVTVQYGPVGFSTVNCGSSNEGSFQPHTMVGNGPSSGYTIGGSFPFQVGNEVMSGRWIMSVTPVKGH
jgi:hypothetical protein